MIPRPLRAGVIAGVAILLLLAAVAALFERFIAEEDAAQRELVLATRLDRLLGETVEMVNEAHASVRGYALTGDRAFLEPYDRTREAIPEHVRELHGMLAGKHRESDADELRAAIEARSTWTNETVALIDAGHLEGARVRIATHEGMTRMTRMRAIVGRIRAEEDGEVTMLLERVHDTRTRLHVSFGVLVVLAVALAALAAFAMRRSLEQLRELARAADESERRFRALAESATDLVRIHARDGRMEYASPSAERLLGYHPDELVAMPPFALVPEKDRARVEATVRAMIASGEASEPIRHALRRRDGTERTYETRVDLVRDDQGQVTRYHTLGRDVTDRVEQEERLTELATKDGLTGLLNPAAFARAASELLARCEAAGQRALFAFCDVNGLKVINDTLGHDAGDAVIVDTARVLQAAARSSDLVARLGGDEFAVLGVVPDDDAAHAFAQRLRARLDTHNASADRQYRLSVSVGTASFEPGRGTTLEALKASADTAMYRHKGTTRGAATTSGDFVRPKGPR